MSDLTELRRIAEKATPGEWEVLNYQVFSRHPCRLVTYGATNSVRRNAETLADMNYIATFNPKAVLAILDRLERAETELNKTTAALVEANKKWQTYEREYILPCFDMAAQSGFDLRRMVSDNPGKNCVVLLIEAFRKHIGERAASKESNNG